MWFFHLFFLFFFFNDTATTEIYTLSLHDALPICRDQPTLDLGQSESRLRAHHGRSEEHTSELQSPVHLVCRLLLEKKKTDNQTKIKNKKKEQTEMNTNIRKKQ